MAGTIFEKISLTRTLLVLQTLPPPPTTLELLKGLFVNTVATDL